MAVIVILSVIVVTINNKRYKIFGGIIVEYLIAATIVFLLSLLYIVRDTIISY